MSADYSKIEDGDLIVLVLDGKTHDFIVSINADEDRREHLILKAVKKSAEITNGEIKIFKSPFKQKVQ